MPPSRRRPGRTRPAAASGVIRPGAASLNAVTRALTYSAEVTSSRKCTKIPCGRPAVATLTYAYAERAVVVGPLATYAEPHAYDLCAEHAMRMTAPRGWDVVRLSDDGFVPVEVNDSDDLLAVVEAVRERPAAAREPAHAASNGGPVGLPVRGVALGRRGHLHVVPGIEE